MTPVRRRASRTAIWVAVLAGLGSAGLGLALGLGLPDPGTAERAFAGLIGLLGGTVAMRWLRYSADLQAPRRRLDAPSDAPGAGTPQAPTVEAATILARSLDLGAETIGAYNLMVLPRLADLAATKLARAGFGLGDASTARELLGAGWELVDPAAPRPTDRMAPGVPLARVAQLVEALEALP